MDIKLEKLEDKKLALRMSKYIASLESIKLRAEYYSLGGCPEKELKELEADYKKVRDGIRADAHYLNYNREKKGSKLLWDKYFPSINGASAWGLTPENTDGFSKVFFEGVDKALKKLTDIYSYDYWQIIAEL